MVAFCLFSLAIEFYIISREAKQIDGQVWASAFRTALVGAILFAVSHLTFDLPWLKQSYIYLTILYLLLDSYIFKERSRPKAN
jgi:hypothetical protein